MNAHAGPPSKIGVFLSGSGRSLENLYDALDSADDMQIVAVIGSRECLGADKARARSIPTRIIKGEIEPDELDRVVDEFDLDLIVLAGYLRRLPITDRTRGRVINIHPALLPDFGGPGMHGTRVHNAVIDAYNAGQVTQSGCTVHFCDEHYDTGSIILQRTCPIEPTDTPETLADRVFKLECDALPFAVLQVLRGLS